MRPAEVYAVVAQEVKALASQTAKATQEIGTQVAGMQDTTTKTGEAIREIIATISPQGIMTRDINVGQATTRTAEVAANISM